MGCSAQFDPETEASGSASFRARAMALYGGDMIGCFIGTTNDDAVPYMTMSSSQWRRASIASFTDCFISMEELVL